MKRLRLLSILCCLTTIVTTAQVPFTAGNIVVYRVGDGTALLNGTAAKVFLDEFTPAGVLVQSILMPTIASGSNNSLTLTGADPDRGFLTRSADGKYLVVPGLNAPAGSAYGSWTAAVIGLVDFNGAINTSTAVADFVEDENQPRSAVSDDGNRLWFCGFGAIRYTTAGNGSSVLVAAGSDPVNSLVIAGGQLYAGLASSPRIRSVGTGLPTTSGQTYTGLPGLPAGTQGPGQFAFADLNPGVAGVDVLYVASTADFVNPVVGIRKFSLVGGLWVDNGSVGGDVANSQYQGLTISVSGSTVTVFATRQGSNSFGPLGGDLVSVTDNSGYNATMTGTPTVLSSIATRFGSADVAAYRGVALVPQASSVKVAAKIFLQGAYNTSLSRHKDVSAPWAAVLNANALTQPYNTAAFGSYAGTESVAASFFASTAGTTDITDWVLVELRDAITPTTVIARRAAFVREDGKIVDTDGTSDVNFPNVDNGNYYIVVRHRNHLGVRSSSAVALSGTATMYDFTTGQAQAFQDGAITSNTAMAVLSTGIYGMWGGNANSNTQTRSSGLNSTTNDFLHLVNIALAGNVATIIPSAYSSDDMNMDGTVRASGLNATTNDLLFLWNTVLVGNTATILTQHQ